MAIFIDIDPNYSPVNEIGVNARVQLDISKLSTIKSTDGSGLNKDYSFVFYSEATPLYASVDYLLLKAGEVIGDLPEAALYLMSFTASTMVDDMILFDIDKKFTDKTTRQYKFFNRARTEYAACIAIQSLLRGIITNRGTTATRKTLADFSIDTASMGNLLQIARTYLNDLRENCKFWETALYSGGAADHMRPQPQTAVRGVAANNDNTAGIGRGWETGGGWTLNAREVSMRAGGSWSRPVRFSSPRHYTSIFDGPYT